MLNSNERHEQILLLVNNSTSRFAFNQVKNLAKPGTVVRSIEVYHVGKRASVGGIDVFTEAAMRDADITLLRGSDEVIQKLPLTRLNPADYNGNLFQCELPDINWENSYIEFYRNTNLSVASKYVLLSVTYTR